MCMPVFSENCCFCIIQGLHPSSYSGVLCNLPSSLHIPSPSSDSFGNLLHSFHSGTKRIYLHLRFFIPDMVGINQRRQNRRQDQKNINNHQDYSPEPFLTVLYYIFHYLSSQESPSGMLHFSLYHKQHPKGFPTDLCIYLHLKCLFYTVIMQKFSICCKFSDLVRTGKHISVCLFSL